MTVTKKSDSATPSTQSLNLVNSQRLKALNESNRNNTCDPITHQSESHQIEDQKRQYIAQQVAKILATLPAGKQKNLFKIRYGLTPEALQRLPIEQAIKILELSLIGDVTKARYPQTRPWIKK